nr:putative non-specific lipid-transfer protein 14 [Gleditsia microphylla]
MGRTEALRIIGTLMLLWWAPLAWAAVECSTVTEAFSACSTFIADGSPAPTPGSPCCDAVSGLNTIANSTVENRQSVCRCLMGLIASYNPNFSAVANLPGFCGVSLGFTIEPDTDCVNL